MTMMLTNLADICRAAGLTVVEVQGWKTRGHGGMTAVRFVVCHHTAGPATGNMPSLDVITDGRPDLPGPLCNLGLGRDGTVYVVAAGLAYHAGAVRDPSYANAYSVGVEAEATGVTSWPAVQMAAYARLCAALVEAYGLTVDRVLGHKEVCDPVGRKSDPNFDMGALRAQVADVIQEDDMPTPAEIAKAVWTIDMIPTPVAEPGNPTWAPQNTLKWIGAKAAAAVDAAAEARAAAASADASARRVEAAVGALAAALGPSVESAVRAAIAEAAVTVTVNINGDRVA
jgi:hypothetical protein